MNRAHFVQEIPARERATMSSTFVGQKRFEKPSPIWYARTEVCLVIPTSSPNGTMTGVATIAWAEPEEMKKLMAV